LDLRIRTGGHSRVRAVTRTLVFSRRIRVADGVRTRDTWSHKPSSDEAARAPSRDSAPLAGGVLETDAEPSPSLPRPAATVEPTDAELERGILDAVRAGLGDVARVLAAQLEARQRARAGNVVELASRRTRSR
jgi:hypothetical protein